MTGFNEGREEATIIKLPKSNRWHLKKSRDPEEISGRGAQGSSSTEHRP
jgi:hypothetical protein